MSKGTGVEKSLAGLRSRKESRDGWEARALTEHREDHGLSGGLPQPVNSHVLHQLLQVLDFKAWTHNRWEALAHLHEESHDLVAEQEASQSPCRTQPSTAAAGTQWSAGPVLRMLPSIPLSKRFTHLGEPGVPRITDL